MGGHPKALLPVGGRTFLEAILAALDDAGVIARRVVVGAHGPEIRAALSLPEKTWVENPDHDAEMLDSFRLGLRSLPLDALDYVLLWPVDHPQVTPATVWAIKDAAGNSGAPVVLPVHGGRRGHPVAFAVRLADELDAVSPGEGARSVVRAHADELEEVEVGDPGILRDVDTPADRPT
jgi:CTP:molybdopterin cytidylyltransferase MocA